MTEVEARRILKFPESGPLTWGQVVSRTHEVRRFEVGPHINEAEAVLIAAARAAGAPSAVKPEQPRPAPVSHTSLAKPSAGAVEKEPPDPLPFVVGSFVCAGLAVLMLVALLPMWPEYYATLRLFALVAVIAVLVCLRRAMQVRPVPGGWFWLVGLVPVAVVFNPFVWVTMERSSWVGVNVGTAALFGALALVLKSAMPAGKNGRAGSIVGGCLFVAVVIGLMIFNKPDENWIDDGRDCIMTSRGMECY